jgi:hypothetical protein
MPKKRRGITDGSLPTCAGIHITKTAMFIIVITAAVPHLTFSTNRRSSATTAIRLMIICISNWISKTHKSNIPKNRGILLTGQLSIPLCSYRSKETAINYSKIVNDSPRCQITIKKQPCYDSDDKVCCDLSPHHIQIRTPQRRFHRHSLLYSRPYCQNSKPNSKSSRQGCNLIILDRSCHGVNITQ